MNIGTATDFINNYSINLKCLPPTQVYLQIHGITTPHPPPISFGRFLERTVINIPSKLELLEPYVCVYYVFKTIARYRNKSHHCTNSFTFKRKSLITIFSMGLNKKIYHFKIIFRSFLRV